MNDMELDMLSKKVDILNKEVDVLTKSVGMEFERIARAFSQIGNLVDLLYLETSVLIELLAAKKVIDEEEFKKLLEDTATKVEAQIKKATDDKITAEKDPEIAKL